MFNKVFSLLIIVLILLSIVSCSNALILTIHNDYNAGENNIADIGHYKITGVSKSVRTYDIKRGEEITNNVTVPNNFEGVLVIAFQTSYLDGGAKLYLQSSFFNTIKNNLGENGTINTHVTVGVTQYKSRYCYLNKLTWIKVELPNGRVFERRFFHEYYMDISAHTVFNNTVVFKKINNYCEYFEVN